MDPHLFAADLSVKPEHLEHLADLLGSDDPWGFVPTQVRQVVLLGMGSSAYAAGVAAARLRAKGVPAVAELAGHDLLPSVTADDLLVAISAGGGSVETRAAVEHYAGVAPVMVLTNSPESELARTASRVVEMHAGVERGGVACRSFQHTLALLLALEQRLTGGPLDLPDLLRRSAAATADLLARSQDWLPRMRDLLIGPDGLHVVAPARRLSSAQQSALMLREGPRIPAMACETADWSHVDVYLTKTTDYRMLLLGGSRWEADLLSWTSKRSSTVVAVGTTPPSAAYSIRYQNDSDDDVRLLTEVLVSELLAADLWSAT